MHPILIVGAVLAGLPILLHLIMKQEPKRLPFPALRFLKQRRRTNQRKMRLRHLLLLAMRVLLIVLFALALFQPTLQSEGLVISGEQPIAAVFVLDTTPSMGYTVAERSRLDDAKKRAADLLDDLPVGSRIAVLDTADPNAAAWEPSAAEARRRIEELALRGGGPPVTTPLVAAYQLLKRAEEEADSPDAEPLPRLVAVFLDRAAASWDAARNEDLIRLRDGVPPPAVAHLYADVGVDRPTNVAILNAEVRPQSMPQNQPVTVAVTVQAAGADVPAAVVRCRLNAAGSGERKEVALRAGTPEAVSFAFKDLKAGFHQAEVSLETADALMADNVRYVTFRVGQARKVLTISDDPDEAILWKLALDGKGDFTCDVKTPAEAADFAGYEAVCLLGVADPSRAAVGGKSLWQRLAEYVGRGGKAIAIPGPTHATGAYDPTASAGVLPGKLVRVVNVPEDRASGVTWLVDDNALRHPLIAPFREWRRLNVDFIRNPRRAWKYWEVEAPPEHAVVAYDNNVDPTKRHPAVLEKGFPNGGKVVLLTVRLDPQWDALGQWHNYWQTNESSWGVVFPNLLMTYLAGDSSDANFNFTTGQAVALPLPPRGEGEPPKLALEGPGVTGPEASPPVGENQTEFRLPPFRALTAGNFALRTDADKSWREAFSLNPPADESNLDKVPADAIEAVFGPDSVVLAGKDLDFREKIEQKFDRPLDLFPWLLIAVLVLFAFEGFLSNRFYRPRVG